MKAVIWVLMGTGSSGNRFYDVISIENWVDWYIRGDMWTGSLEHIDDIDE